MIESRVFARLISNRVGGEDYDGKEVLVVMVN